MTQEYDPNRPSRHPMGYDRDGDGFGYFPIALSIAALLIIGYMFMGPRNEAPSVPRETNTRTEAPAIVPNRETPAIPQSDSRPATPSVNPTPTPDTKQP